METIAKCSQSLIVNVSIISLFTGRVVAELDASEAAWRLQHVHTESVISGAENYLWDSAYIWSG